MNCLYVLCVFSLISSVVVAIRRPIAERSRFINGALGIVTGLFSGALACVVLVHYSPAESGFGSQPLMNSIGLGAAIAANEVWVQLARRLWGGAEGKKV